MLTALVLFGRFNRATRSLLVAGIWLSALATLTPMTLEAFAGKPGPHLFRNTLACSVALGTVAAFVERRPLVALTSLLGQVPLWKLVDYLKESDGDLAALHLAWLGLVVGLLARRGTDALRRVEHERPATEGSYVVHDIAVFLGATAVASLVCVYVLDRRDGSADEVAYTFQAATFAKGHAYAQAGRCENYLQSYWVFEASGRLFSQYPPGWPLFMAPFVWVRAAWLSGPLSMGLMACGIARLSRSAMRAFGPHDAPPAARTIALAGTWGAALSTFAATILLNGASRFPHVYVAALYAFSLEGLLQIATPGLSRARQVCWGAALGTASVMAVASRPADGAFVGFGIAVLFVYWLARGSMGWRAVAAPAAAGGLAGAVVLVILRLQLGKWFTTGYSLQPIVQPWATMKYSTPTEGQWRFGLPLSVGSYCWWPCSLPLGLAGLAMLRGRARGLPVAMGLGLLPYFGFLAFLEYSRTPEFEYGPRYHSIIVVPMAVGCAVALAGLTRAAFERSTAGRSALARGGPLALAIFAVVSGWLRVVPLEWPLASEHVRRHSGLDRAIERANLKNAVVLASEGTTGFADQDLPTNYPLDLYPDQDVIKTIDRGEPSAAVECLKSAFPGRRILYASGVSEVRLSASP